MSKYSWDDADRELSERQREGEAQAQEAARKKAEELARGRRQYEEISRTIIQPFLRAMRLAGNPGSSRGRRRSERFWVTGRTTVNTNGTWSTQYQDGNFTPAHDPDIYHMSTEYVGEPLPEAAVRSLMYNLAQLLRSHGVPVPRS